MTSLNSRLIRDTAMELAIVLEKLIWVYELLVHGKLAHRTRTRQDEKRHRLENMYIDKRG